VVGPYLLIVKSLGRRFLAIGLKFQLGLSLMMVQTNFSLRVIFREDRFPAFKHDAQVFFVAYGLAPRVYQSSKDIQAIARGHHHTVALTEPIRHQATVLHDQHADYLALGTIPPFLRMNLHDSIRGSNLLSLLDRSPLLPELLMFLPCLFQLAD
jgi:hypothetical protein